MKKVYFAWSIRWGRDDAELYKKIIEYISQYALVLTEHIWDIWLSNRGEFESKETYIYTRDVAWIDECDIVIAEVTTPSLWVWYELWYAEAHGKPVYCLDREQPWKSLSAMVEGNEYFSVFRYEAFDDELREYVRSVL